MPFDPDSASECGSAGAFRPAPRSSYAYVWMVEMWGMGGLSRLALRQNGLDFGFATRQAVGFSSCSLSLFQRDLPTLLSVLCRHCRHATSPSDCAVWFPLTYVPAITSLT